MKPFFWRRSVEAQAADWFVRTQSQTFDTADDRRLTHWLETQPLHEEALASAEIAWALSEDLAESPRIREELQQILTERAEPGVRRRLGTPALSPRLLAAGVGTLVVMAALLALWLRPFSPALTFQTSIGEQRNVQLPDGSTVTLNTATDLRVRLTRNARDVHLIQGEALFNVARDKRPFVVRALSGTVTDTGTQFDVRQQDARTVTVSVLDGSVHIANARTDRSLIVGDLKAGEALDYGADGSLSAVRPADTPQIRAWLAHRIAFSDVTLAEAVQQYNRYAQHPLILGPNAPADRKISGVFRIGDEAAFVRALEQQLKLKAKADDSARIVLETQ